MSISKINAGGTSHNLIGANVAYGTCATAAATAAKVVTVTSPGWELEIGSIIGVKFTYTNSASNPTLNVNSTGAKSIWYNTAVITTSSLTYAGYAARVMYYMYDGTQYVFFGWSYDANTQSTTNSTNTSNKIFLIGATSQGSNKTTYSHDTAYVGTDGCLYSNSIKVSVEGHTHDYLPLSGGTITGTSGNTPLTLKSATTSTYIPFVNSSGTVLGHYGFDSANTPTVYLDKAYKVYHEGNKPTASAIGAAASSHNQAASTITAGTLAGRVDANATATATLANLTLRNIYIKDTDMTAGSTSLTTGAICLVYE